jgi:hypothetical protein
VDPDPDFGFGSGSGPRRAKMTTKIEKKFQKNYVLTNLSSYERNISSFDRNLCSSFDRNLSSFIKEKPFLII